MVKFKIQYFLRLQFTKRCSKFCEKGVTLKVSDNPRQVAKSERNLSLVSTDKQVSECVALLSLTHRMRLSTAGRLWTRERSLAKEAELPFVHAQNAQAINAKC